MFGHENWYENRRDNRHQNYLFLTGVFIMAFAVGEILEPAHLVTGGAAGIAIVVKSASAKWFQMLGENVSAVNWLFQAINKMAENNGIPLWITTLTVNVPLFIVAYKRKGKKFLGKSLIGTLLLSLFLALLPQKQFMPDDLLLNALFGGLLEGIGLGLVLRAKGSTGGSDLFATILHQNWPQYSISRIMAVIDGAIVLMGVLVFGIVHGGYSLITVYMVAYVSDLVVAGFGKSVLVHIISDQYENIAECIMKELERGVTAVPSIGLYKNKNRQMLLCVVSKKQLVYVQEIVYKLDSKAFVMLTDTRETLGEGFNKIGNNIL